MGKSSHIFTTKEAMRTLDVYRMVYALIALIAFILTEAGRHIYRPYIYQNNIEDYGLADAMGNLGGIVVQIFFTLAVLNSPKQKVLHVVLLLVCGYIAYEILQPYLPKGVFDWKDIYGTLIGGGLSMLILLLIQRKIRNKVLYRFS